MKLAVVGSRNFKDKILFEELLDDQFDLHMGSISLISDGAEGADKFAENWAKDHGVKIFVILPDYKNHPHKLAPLYRNQEIAMMCDQMLAFWDGKSKGTKNAIEHAVSFKKFVMIQGF